MKIGQRRIKFIWGASRVIQARWRFGLIGFYEHVKGHPGSGLAVSVRGWLILALLLALLAYVAGATALFFWLDRRTHNYVTYSDTLLLPFRLDEIRAKRGQGYIEEGIDDLKAQRWAQAEMKLRVGLRRYPQDLRARMQLAEFNLLTQRRPVAMKLLRDGLEAAKDYPGRRYLTLYFDYARQGEEHERIIAAAEHCRTRWPQLAPSEQEWLQQQHVVALLANNETETASALLEASPDTPQFNELRVLALLEAGEPDAAVAFLGNWAARSGLNQQILRLQVRALRETGKLAEMESALNALRELAPTNPNPYAYGIVQRALAGEETAALAALNDYFLRFGANQRATQLLAAPLAQIKSVTLLEALIVRLREQGHDQQAELRLLAQTQMTLGNWRDAAATLAQLQRLPAQTTDNTTGQALLETLITVLTDPAEGPRLQLLELINRQPMPLGAYRSVIEPLLRAGRHQTALDVVARAERHYPESAALVGYKAEAQVALAAAVAPVTPTVSLPASGAGLAEGEFFTKLDSMMLAGEWPGAAELLREAQAGKPGWLGARQPDLLARQMRIAQERGANPEMVLAVRLLLDGSLLRAQTVVAYATELHSRGKKEPAVLLLREVLRNIPAHATARRLLAEWETPAETPVPTG
jgi:predicted Zn-dependent protease